MAMAQADGSIVIGTELDTGGVERGMDRLGSAVGKAALAAAAAWGVFTVAVSKTGDAFDAAMAPIQARTGMAGEALAELEVGLRDLSRRGTHSAAQIAGALGKVAVAGMGAAEAHALMGYAQTLALAAGADLGKATQFLGLALTKTGAEVYSAREYVDVFAQVAAVSGMALGNLQKAVVALAPTMNATGMSIQEASGALATLYQGGLYGIGAARGLEQVFAALSGTASDAAAEAVKALGVSMFDAAGNMRPFNDVAAETMDAIGGLATEQERAAKTAGIFRTVYGRAAFDELMNNRDAWQANTAAMREAGDAFGGLGQAYGMMGVQARGLGVSLGAIRNALSDMLITVWQTKSGAKLDLLDMIAARLWAVADALRPGGRLHGGLLAFQRVQSAVFDGFIGAAQTVLGLLGRVAGALDFSAMGAALGPPGRALASVGAAVGGLVAAVGSLAGAFLDLGGASHGAGGPLRSFLEAAAGLATIALESLAFKIGLVGGALSALAGAFGGLSIDTGALGGAFGFLFDALAAALGLFATLWERLDLAGAAAGIFRAAVYSLASTFNILATVVPMAASVLGPLLAGVLEEAAGLFRAVLGAAQTVIGDLPVLIGALSGVAAAVSGAVLAALRLLLPVLGFMADNIRLLYPLLAYLAYGFAKLKIINAATAMLKAFNLGQAKSAATTHALNKQLAVFGKQNGFVAASLVKKSAAMKTSAVAAQVAAGALGKFSAVLAKAAKFAAATWGALKKIGTASILPALTLQFGKLETAVKGLSMAKVKDAFLSLFAVKAGGAASVGLLAKAHAFLASTLGALKTAAKALFKVLMLNPVFAIAAAVAALAVGLAYLIRRVRQVSEEYAYARDAARGFKEAALELAGAARESSEAFDGQRGAFAAHRQSTEELAESVFGLGARQNRTAGETVLLNRKIGELNSLVPGLGLAIDETAGSLNKSAEAVGAFVRAAMETEYLNHMTERQNALVAEQAGLMEKAAAVQERLARYREKEADGTRRRRADQRALNETIGYYGEALVSLAAQLRKNGHAQDGLTESIKAQMEAVGLSMEAAEAQMALMARQEAALAAVGEVWEQYAGTVSGVLGRVSGDSEMTAEQLIKDFEAQTAALNRTAEDWAEFAMRMDTLDRMAQDLGVADYVLEHLGSLGLDGLPLIRQFTDGGEDLFMQFADAIGRTNRAAMEATRQQFKAITDNAGEALYLAAQAIRENSAMADAAVAAVAGVGPAVAGEIERAGFPGLGRGIAEGTANGVASGHGAMREAGGRGIDEICDEMERRAQIGSPSRRTHAIGEALGQGLANGLLGALEGVYMAARKTVEAIAGTIGAADLYRAGAQAAGGLAAGLGAQARDVRQAARQIAGAVPETMREYLQIQSPSRLTERNVGLPAGMGIARGLESARGGIARAAEETGAAIGAGMERSLPDTRGLAERLAIGMEAGIRGQAPRLAGASGAAGAAINKAMARMLEERGREQRSAGEAEAAMWGEHLAAYVRAQEAKTDETRRAAAERDRAHRQESEMFMGWVDTRIEALGLAGAAELGYMRDLKDGLGEGSRFRLALEERHRDRQLELLRETHMAQENTIRQMMALEEEYMRALENRAGELARTFDMFSQLGLRETNADRNRQEAERLAEAYERARERLAEIGREMRGAERGSEQWRRAQQRQAEAQREVEKAHASLTEATRLAAKSQAAIMGHNLEAQIENMREWERELEALAGRGVYEGVIEHMRALGPAAVRYLQQLNASSDKELQRLSGLYREAHATARRVAENELRGMREDTSRQISELAGELQALGLKEYELVGRNMVQGIVNGVAGSGGMLNRAVQNMAAEALDQIKRAWRIASPSRESAYLGMMFASGIAGGLMQGMAYVRRAVGSLTEYVGGLGGLDLSSVYDACGIAGPMEKHAGRIKAALAEKLAGAAETARGALGDGYMRDAGGDAGGAFTEGLAEGIKAGMEGVYETAREISGTVASLVNKPFEYLSGAPELRLGIDIDEGMDRLAASLDRMADSFGSMMRRIDESSAAKAAMAKRWGQDRGGGREPDGDRPIIGELVIEWAAEGQTDQERVEEISRVLGHELRRELRSLGVMR